MCRWDEDVGCVRMIFDARRTMIENLLEIHTQLLFNDGADDIDAFMRGGIDQHAPSSRILLRAHRELRSGLRKLHVVACGGSNFFRTCHRLGQNTMIDKSECGFL